MDRSTNYKAYITGGSHTSFGRQDVDVTSQCYIDGAWIEQDIFSSQR